MRLWQNSFDVGKANSQNSGQQKLGKVELQAQSLARSIMSDPFLNTRLGSD